MQILFLESYRRTIFCDETEESEQSCDLVVFAVGQDGDEGHDVVLDRVPIHRVDLRQDASQRIVAGNDGIDDRLVKRNSKKNHLFALQVF